MMTITFFERLFNDDVSLIDSAQMAAAPRVGDKVTLFTRRYKYCLHVVEVEWVVDQRLPEMNGVLAVCTIQTKTDR